MNKKQLRHLPALDKKEPPYETAEKAYIEFSGFRVLAYVAGVKGPDLVFTLRQPYADGRSCISDHGRIRIRRLTHYEVRE